MVLLLMFANFAKAENRGYQEWLKKRDELKQDSSVARYYTFEDVKDSKSIVKDLSVSGADLKFVPYRDRETGKVFDDLQVIEGRWPEKKAVRLDRGFYQGPAFNIGKNQFTAEVWFRRQGPGSILPASKLNNGHILAVSGYRKGWHLLTTYDPEPGITFGIGMPGGHYSAGSVIKLDAAMPDNTWHHIAVTWDGKDMRLYLTGQLKGTAPLEKDYIPVGDQDSLKVGYAKAGVGSLIMDIGEIVIYDRALTSSEIEKLGRGPEEVSGEDIFNRADSFIAAGEYEKARAEYEKLRGLPNFGKEQALFNIAESFRIEKNYDSVHKAYKEILRLEGLNDFYRIYALFREAEAYIEQKDYNSARQLYEEIIKKEGALNRHVFKARLCTGDTFRSEGDYFRARDIYEKLLREEESSSFPNDGYRLEARDRLEEIEGLRNGADMKDLREQRVERINKPRYAVYVSVEGSNSNTGTRKSPFATIKRAQEEVIRVKEKGMPAGGIVVYLRAGRYFIEDSIVFGREDSGSEDSPVVYRNYPGEEVRIIGGKEIANFKPLTEPDTLRRLPEEARDKVWTADIREAGISKYGELVTRGFRRPRPGALELICNGKVMKLARWPNREWTRVAGITEVDGVTRKTEYQVGKFIYSGTRPERWKEEKDMWVKGYLGVNQPFALTHMKIGYIDTKKKVINLLPDTLPEACPWWGKAPVAKNHPYFVYNLLSEIDMPGEWYLDRETGRLYFYPPGDISNCEAIVTTLDDNIISFRDASEVILYGLILEGTWRHGIEIKGGKRNLVAGCVIRNTGQWAVKITSGWEHGVIGCDMHDMGEGGVFLDGGDRKKLIPARHTVDNNHIYGFNRFCGGPRQAIKIEGVGQRISHNVIHDSPHQGIRFNANDHIIEYNEIHDLPHEAREIGAIYTYGEPWYLMNRGSVVRNNLIHHISYRSSPNLTHGLNGIHVDAMNAGLVFTKNIFYRVPTGISSTFPGNYLTNNIFVDVENRGIGQGDRSNIFCNERDINGGPNIRMMNRLAARLKSVNYKQPPWNYRYPPLVGMMEVMPSRWGSIQGSIIEHNINTGGPFISFNRNARATTRYGNNWDGQRLLFAGKENMDFSIRPGSPVFGLTGCEPVKMEGIGVYMDELRVSWPINRTKEDIGKYYNPDWSQAEEVKATMKAVQRISSPLTYNVVFPVSSIEIDGKLEKDEWLGLDKKKAMAIERHHKQEGKKGPINYAWVLCDRTYLYIATEHTADPWIEGMPLGAKDHLPKIEVAIESRMGPQSQDWWPEDMLTGPIYSIACTCEGQLEINNLFGMDYKQKQGLEKSIEYKTTIFDRESLIWTSEMKIPLNLLGIDPAEVERLAFNIGVHNRGGWFAWVPTGATIWRLENAGFIEFVK